MDVGKTLSTTFNAKQSNYWSIGLVVLLRLLLRFGVLEVNFGVALFLRTTISLTDPWRLSLPKRFPKRALPISKRQSSLRGRIVSNYENVNNLASLETELAVLWWQEVLLIWNLVLPSQIDFSYSIRPKLWNPVWTCDDGSFSCRTCLENVKYHRIQCCQFI